jgi:hypothetical protein
MKTKFTLFILSMAIIAIPFIKTSAMTYSIRGYANDSTNVEVPEQDTLAENQKMNMETRRYNLCYPWEQENQDY